MPMSWRARFAISYSTHRAARRWVTPHEPFTRRIRAPCNDSGTGCSRRSSWRPLPFLECLRSQIAIDLFHIGIGQRTDGLFEPQMVDHEIVVRLREVESGLKYLLLLVQHVEIGAHADFQTELVGIVRNWSRSKRLLEGFDLRDAVGNSRERRLRQQLRTSARGLQVLAEPFLIGDRLAHAGADRTALI